MKHPYDIAAYIWPAYTGAEPRARLFWPEGMGEWQSVRSCKAKIPGDTWPRRPLWGYVDEADSRVMEMEIDAAADYGVNVFIYDWYWFDQRPFLNQCLERGYLKARNNSRVRFMLMWSNHDACHVWDKRLSESDMWLDPLWRGGVDSEAFSHLCDVMIEKYFHHPSYYKIEGKPVLMVYDPKNLIQGLGGISNTALCLTEFREKCVRAGLNGLHLQFKLSRTDGVFTPGIEAAKRMGFDSITSYQFGELTDIDREYREICAEMPALWEDWNARFGLPYFPQVSVGWDNSPRFATKRRFGVTRNNTPQLFEKALRMAKKFVDDHALPAKLITVNSWNEWTEGSYLQPDDRTGYQYLEAVQRVFLKD